MDIPRKLAGRLIDGQELASYLGVATYSVWSWARAGSIPCYRSGRSIRFDLREVLTSMQGTEEGKKIQKEGAG